MKSSVFNYSQVLVIILCFLILLVQSCNSGNKKNDEDGIKEPTLLLIGTYTENQANGIDEKSKGIYLYHFNFKTGELSFVATSPETVNPSYLAIHPSKKWIYAVNEVGDSATMGRLSAFSIDTAKNEIKFINTVSSQGTFPCYVSIDRNGKFAMTANYGNGTVALYSINSDGSLTDAKSVHQHMAKSTDGPEVKPHAHMIVQDPANQTIFSSDLGTDMVWVYQLDTMKVLLKPAKMHIPTQTGAGPRHIEFHPKQARAYVINELNGTIEAFTTGQNFGNWSHFQTISTLPSDEKRAAKCADIHITPSGKYLYASNRGDINTLAIFEINQQSGELKPIGFQDTKGKTPRNFVIDPTGTFLLVANQNSNSVITFKIDNISGKLTETGHPITIPSPVCLKFY